MHHNAFCGLALPEPTWEAHNAPQISHLDLWGGWGPWTGSEGEEKKGEDKKGGREQ